MTTLTNKKDFWLRHLEALSEAGTSQRAYCDAHGLKAHQLSYWKNKLQHNDQSKPLTAPSMSTRLVPVAIQATPYSGGLVLSLPNGLKLSGITRDTLPLVQPVVEALR